MFEVRGNASNKKLDRYVAISENKLETFRVSIFKDAYLSVFPISQALHMSLTLMIVQWLHSMPLICISCRKKESELQKDLPELYLLEKMLFKILHCSELGRMVVLSCKGT